MKLLQKLVGNRGTKRVKDKREFYTADMQLGKIKYSATVLANNIDEAKEMILNDSNGNMIDIRKGR